MRGDELTPWLIRYGYEQGAFPMTVDDGEVEWFQPMRRALFDLRGIHVSRSMRKEVAQVELGNRDAQKFGVTFDKSFEDVMRSCMRPDGNWISEEFIRVYTLIHDQGWGHSVEVWRQGRLIGGLYGIAIGSVFCAESMFHRETNASKVALWAIINKCRELGFSIFDAQIINPHLASLGAFEIPNEDYLAQLEQACSETVRWE